jgi:hypothetical protein
MSGKLGALLFAAGLPLGLFAGSAVADGYGGGYGGHKSGDVDNENSASAWIDQYSEVGTRQEAKSNSGHNKALSGVLGANETEQDCDADASDGNISGGVYDAHAGNKGGECSNDATSENDGTSKASISTGPASATNKASTSVKQSNSGGVDVDQEAKASDIHSGGGDVNNSNSAKLSVDQSSDVWTGQSAYANSGGNFAASGVIGYNATGQYADADADGGNIGGGGHGGYGGYDSKGSYGGCGCGHDLTTGNTGGTASNTAASSNTGSSTASITTGAATASNSSTTTVTQTNSGGVSGSQSATASDIHS